MWNNKKTLFKWGEMTIKVIVITVNWITENLVKANEWGISSEIWINCNLHTLKAFWVDSDDFRKFTIDSWGDFSLIKPTRKHYRYKLKPILPKGIDFIITFKKEHTLHWTIICMKTFIIQWKCIPNKLLLHYQ